MFMENRLLDRTNKKSGLARYNFQAEKFGSHTFLHHVPYRDVILSLFTKQRTKFTLFSQKHWKLSLETWKALKTFKNKNSEKQSLTLSFVKQSAFPNVRFKRF